MAVVLSNAREGDDMTLEEEGCDTGLPRGNNDSMRGSPWPGVDVDTENDDCMLEDGCEEEIP